MSNRPILIVEDDDNMRECLLEMVSENYIATGAGTLAEARQLLSEKDARFDAILLDIGMPDGDGRDFCTELRREGHNMPILLLTGATQENDVISGLAVANDHIGKPFRVKELLARIDTQLRMYDTSENAVFTLRHFTFHPFAKYLIDRNKRRIPLTAKEVFILRYLIRHADKTVSRQALLDNVWGYHSEASTHTLETHIYRLRQKIETDLSDTQIIVSVPGGGYRLNLNPELSTKNSAPKWTPDNLMAS